jgi:acyl-CoA thioester hydrolase
MTPAASYPATASCAAHLFEVGRSVLGVRRSLSLSLFNPVTMSPTFEMIVLVLPADIDEQNHVNNTVYVRWVQEVATAHWRAIASPEVAETIGWVVLRHEIDYKAPAMLGDEIVLRTWVGEATRLRFERFTQIRRKSGAESFRGTDSSRGKTAGQLLSQARTLWCPIDAKNGKPVRVAAAVRSQFSI